MGVKISHSGLFSNQTLKLPVTVLKKVTYWDFEISNLYIYVFLNIEI